MGKADIIQQLVEHFHRENVHNVVILTDKNVEKWYAHYFSALSEHVNVDKLVLNAGEQTKSIESAIQIWDYLTDKQYDRNLFLLNFGGGMISDLGGYVASTYKRGIRFANCPTTLLAMIDASVGGKTGVNLLRMKNAVGTFYFPSIQLPVDLSFLGTLPSDEMLSGLGELVKYALIGSADLFCSLTHRNRFPSLTIEDVNYCIDFKTKIVKEDPYDRGVRRILNFGHTIGHAVESWRASQGTPMPHGIAVANGLYYESLISMRLGRLPQEEWQEIETFLPKHFQILDLTPELLNSLLPYMKNDKKNHDGAINFTLLDHIGQAIPDCSIPSKDIPTLLTF